MIELILALLMGVIIGTITGVIPSFHTNLLSAILLTLSGFFLTLTTPLALAIFIVALSTTHLFINFIPSILLGAPNEDNTALSVLPGHELLIKGQGYSAIIYSLYGCLIGLILTLVFSPLFYFFLPTIYSYAQRIMPFILILTTCFLIYFEKTNKIWAIIIFTLSGFLGLATLTLPLTEPLLPLFTGLFGISSLISSLGMKQKIPEQKIKSLKQINQTLTKKSMLKTIFASSISSPLCSFLPGLGSGQAAVIGAEVTGDLNRKEFLILLGAISTIVTSLSFITYFSIQKARTGVAVAIGKLLILSLTDIYYITGAIILSGVLAFFISMFLAKIFSRIISKINYPLVSCLLILFLVNLNIFFSGIMGLFVLLVSTCLGLLCIYSGVRRTHLMGCLIIPAIILLL